MTKYKILFNDIEVALLEVDEEKNLHRYTVYRENLEKAKAYMPIPAILPNETNWIKPIPFYDNRIKNCTRQGRDSDVIGYFTDNCTLVRIHE